MQSRGRPNRVVKPNAQQRRPNAHRRIDEEQLTAHFGSHGNTAADDDVMGHVVHGYGRGDDEDDAVTEPDADHVHAHDHGEGPHAHVDAMDHDLAPMAPMDPSQQHHHHAGHHQHHHHQGIDDLANPELLQDAGGLYAAAAAAAAADLQPPPPPPPPLGSTMPAPQPLVAATDFQPNPLPQQQPPRPPTPPPQPTPQPQSAVAAAAAEPPPPQPQPQPQPPPPPPPPQAQQPNSSQPAPPHKTTKEMALESGYEGFKVDSAFAKRMSRDPGQRLAEQRRHGQDLNLVRRSNVEALFAQIAGVEAAHPCAHCRKGQGPWTVCVVYSGQMMGSCANCWFNASGSRCSFHEKSQPAQPAAHPYAVPVPIPTGAVSDQGPGAGVSNGFAPAGTGASPAQLQAAALWTASGALFSHDAGVKGTVQAALVQVRQATAYQRALIEVEVAAKQLALKIVQAEEIAGALGQEGMGGGGDGREGAVMGEDEDEEMMEGNGEEDVVVDVAAAEGVHQQLKSQYDTPPGVDVPEGGL